jgi:hypothetical protein
VFRHFTGICFFTREPVGELSLYFFSCITLICFYFELNIYGRLPTIPTKIVPRKKLKGRHWKDEISALTSVSLGSSTEKRGRIHFFEECSLHIPLRLEGKIAKTTLQTLVMTLSIEGLLFFFAIFNITRASHLQKV